MTQMKKQRALLIIKPDGVRRGLCGTILKRFERVGLTIVGFKFITADSALIKALYSETGTGVSKAEQKLVDYFQESPVLVVAVEGYEAIKIVNKLSGNTIPMLAASGTVRGDFSHDSALLANSESRPLRNIVHVSRTVKDGEKEVAVWFKNDELFSYKRADEDIMFSS